MEIFPKFENAVVTICALNYLSKALVLRESFLSKHNSCDFYILIIDKKNEKIVLMNSDILLLWIEDLDMPNFYRYAFKFDIIELSTNVKPTILSKLLMQYQTVLYLDPDIFVYDYLSPVYDSLQSHSIVVTPHTMQPVLDGMNPSDIDFLRFGAFNLGFVGVRKCLEAFNFLRWWSSRCLEFGFYEPQSGLAVDQKWLDLAPCFFPELFILRDPGLNVAFWNLHERAIKKTSEYWEVNGAPLYFFHFSSFMPNSPNSIANKQSRFKTGSRPDINPLTEEYAKAILSKNSIQSDNLDYSFDFFETGEYISPTVRRFYSALEENFPENENPFVMNSKVHRYFIKKGLVSQKILQAQRYTFKELNSFSFFLRITNLVLRIVLKLVGPNRYFSLMKFLVHISVIRNQKKVL